MRTTGESVLPSRRGPSSLGRTRARAPIGACRPGRRCRCSGSRDTPFVSMLGLGRAGQLAERRCVSAQISETDVEGWQSSGRHRAGPFAGYHDLEGADARVDERARCHLIARHAIDEQSADELLRRHARVTSRKLLDLCRGRRRPRAACVATAGAFVALTGFAARDGGAIRGRPQAGIGRMLDRPEKYRVCGWLRRL